MTLKRCGHLAWDVVSESIRNLEYGGADRMARKGAATTQQ